VDVERIHDEVWIGLNDSVDINQGQNEAFSTASSVFCNALQVVTNSYRWWPKSVEFCDSGLGDGQLIVSIA